MILYELLGKHLYVSKKAKTQKSPVSQVKTEKPAGIGAALDRIRSQLKRDELKVKAKEPIVNESQQSQNHIEEEEIGCCDEKFFENIT
jgi:hypothetical protein